MENFDLLLKIGTLLVAIATAYVTCKLTLVFISKRQDEHNKTLEAHEKHIHDINLKLEGKVSYEHIEQRYVTKEELRLYLLNIETKQQNILDKVGEIAQMIREKG